MYAVFDTETTGISPKNHHRIVEIAVVLTDDDGRVEHEWSTLLHPERDLGPQHIHGIQAKQVKDAPRFSDIADQLVALMAGRTLVAHNLPFDVTFVAAEFDRMGVDFPATFDIGVCTMNWARTFLPGSGRNLLECCRSAGISLTGWHSALSDANATTRLLARYIDAANGGVPWADRLEASRSLNWPRLPERNRPVHTRDASRSQAARAEEFVASLIAFAPRVDTGETTDPYLAVLDETLSDRYLSDDESAALRALAANLGLTPERVDQLHVDYLDALARIALSDAQLSSDELKDLRQVAAILGLTDEAIDTALEKARGDRGLTAAPGELPIEPGDMIVFTGTMPEPRELWLQRAADHGFVPHSGVTKKVKLVVAADPDSLSGKAGKARGYGIPIVGIDWFRAALGYPEPAPGEFVSDGGWPDEHGWVKRNRGG